LSKKYSRLYQEDIKKLRRTKLIEINCPACNAKSNQVLIRKMGFTYVICDKCKTVFINPRPSSKALTNFFISSKSIEFWDKILEKTASIRKNEIFKPRLNLVQKILQEYKIQNCKKMIEIGPGHGWFCELAKKQNLADKIVAIEPSPYFFARCSKIRGIEVKHTSIEEYYSQLHGDLIVSFEVVNYLSNPNSFLSACYNGLRRNGLLILSLTNYFGLDIQILKEKSEYFSPTHQTLFNPESIEKLLKTIGFRKIRIITPGLMDLSLVLNKIKSGELDAKNYPFFKLILEKKSTDLNNDLQILLQKHKLSSHMVVSAKK
jgi:2-polyprenyl-3-methyl-5-hydroxy-6-metoxy-1,4-benzoquinol methylase